MHSIELKRQEQSNPIGILNLIANYLEEHSFDARTVFEHFGIQREDLKNNLLPISLQTQGRIFQAVEALTGCDHLGLVIGKKAQFSNIGPLRFLVLNAATMRDAMQSLFHYGSMWYRGQKLDLKEDGRLCAYLHAYRWRYSRKGTISNRLFSRDGVYYRTDFGKILAARFSAYLLPKAKMCASI